MPNCPPTLKERIWRAFPFNPSKSTKPENQREPPIPKPIAVACQVNPSQQRRLLAALSRPLEVKSFCRSPASPTGPKPWPVKRHPPSKLKTQTKPKTVGAKPANRSPTHHVAGNRSSPASRWDRLKLVESGHKTQPAIHPFVKRQTCSRMQTAQAELWEKNRG